MVPCPARGRAARRNHAWWLRAGERHARRQTVRHGRGSAYGHRGARGQSRPRSRAVSSRAQPELRRYIYRSRPRRGEREREQADSRMTSHVPAPTRLAPASTTPTLLCSCRRTKLQRMSFKLDWNYSAVQGPPYTTVFWKSLFSAATPRMDARRCTHGHIACSSPLRTRNARPRTLRLSGVDIARARPHPPPDSAEQCARKKYLAIKEYPSAIRTRYESQLRIQSIT
ncbi:hypothetical protein C2E23DRAFT_421539 [Lenzites betulinus]|nr:hypothetical protein C2E23DRAFT_421539 [Lenzites betulinus]